jgi:hypothetical protein
MVWSYFARGDEVLRLEARREDATGDYILAGLEPDGRTWRQRFHDPGALRRRLVRVELRLDNEQWVRAWPPIVIPETGSR